MAVARVGTCLHTQANDLAQLVFAMYAALAVNAASAANTHISLQSEQDLSGVPQASWKIYLQWLCVVPWACFMVWTWWGDVLRSVFGLERFVDSNLPAYFVLKIALLLLVMLLALRHSRLAWRTLRGHA